MSEPAYALQAAVYATLAASATLKTLVGDPVRAFDRVPPTAVYPYLTITGDEQIIDDGDGCGDAWECFQSVHVWSDAIGMPQAKTIAGAVRDALVGVIPVTGFRVVEGLHQSTRYLKDPNPLIEHAVVTFRYLIDPA